MDALKFFDKMRFEKLFPSQREKTEAEQSAEPSETVSPQLDHDPERAMQGALEIWEMNKQKAEAAGNAEELALANQTIAHIKKSLDQE